MNNLVVNFDNMMNFVYSNPFIEALFFAILAVFVLKLFGMAFRVAMAGAVSIGVLIVIYAFVTGGDFNSSVKGLVDIGNKATVVIKEKASIAIGSIKDTTSTVK